MYLRYNMDQNSKTNFTDIKQLKIIHVRWLNVKRLQIIWLYEIFKHVVLEKFFEKSRIQTRYHKVHNFNLQDLDFYSQLTYQIQYIYH